MEPPSPGALLSPPPPSEHDRPATLRTLAEQLPRFIRLVHALKAGQADGRAALSLLFPLERLGPLRPGALAEVVHADPSTVSRHVAALIEQGLVRRIADESDGRASRLVVTEAGRAALGQLRAEREEHLGRVTAGWPAADLATLTDLFGRFLDDLAATLPTDPAGAPVAAPRDQA